MPSPSSNYGAPPAQQPNTLPSPHTGLAAPPAQQPQQANDGGVRGPGFATSGPPAAPWSCPSAPPTQQSHGFGGASTAIFAHAMPSPYSNFGTPTEQPNILPSP